MSKICKSNPGFAEIGSHGDYYIQLDKLADSLGIDLVTAFMLPTQRWTKAVVLAKRAGISRRTVSSWCRNRARFAIRIGKLWYVNLNEWEAPSGLLGNTTTEG